MTYLLESSGDTHLNSRHPRIATFSSRRGFEIALFESGCLLGPGLEELESSSLP